MFARLANLGWTGRPTTGDGRNRRPEPDNGMLVGALAASVGYLLPWFRQGGGWSYSGWGYAGLGAGGAWTLATFGWLALAVGGALWARHSVTAAMVGMGGVVGAMFSAVAVVVAGVATLPQGDSLDDAGGLPFGVGLPLMAAGFGWAVAASCRAIVVGSRPRAGAAAATDPPR